MFSKFGNLFILRMETAFRAHYLRNGYMFSFPNRNYFWNVGATFSSEGEDVAGSF